MGESSTDEKGEGIGGCEKAGGNLFEGGGEEVEEMVGNKISKLGFPGVGTVS